MLLDLHAAAEEAVFYPCVAITGKENIYRAQLVDRAASPAHRQSTARLAFATVSVGELMAQPQLVVHVDAEAQSALGELRDADLPGAPVTDSSGRYCRAVTQQDLAGFAGHDHHATLRDALRGPAMPTLTANLGFDAAVEAVSRGTSGGPRCSTVKRSWWAWYPARTCFVAIAWL